MILYKDDSKLALKVVATITGDKEYRRNCRFIRSTERPEGAFYVMDQDCFHVEGQWHRIESGKIEFDYEKKAWSLKGVKPLTRGVVAIEGDKLVYGTFTPNVYNNCKVNSPHRTSVCINSDILVAANYVEDWGTNIWYSKAGMTPGQIKKLQTIRNEVNHHNKGYNIEDNAVEFDQKKDSYANYPTQISKEARAYAKFLGESTFGAEIETSEGNVASGIQYQTGLVVCRDGSIQSAEYVTVPMAGAKGVQNIVTVAESITDRCNIDINCSLHYHFGNTPKEREYIVSLYILAYKIQDDIFKMFPYFKTDHRGFKKKNYCQKLKKMSIYPCKDFSKEGYNTYIDEVYIKIFTFLSDGHLPGDKANRKRQQHPIVHKWDRKSRYYWLNLQNMIFSERETAEFRLHTATTNKTKMVAWLFICNAIVKYAEKHMREILEGEGKISFTQVLNYYVDEFPRSSTARMLSKYLIGYYENRCNTFARDLENGDKLSEHDIKDDKTFNFALDGVTLL